MLKQFALWKTVAVNLCILILIGCTDDDQVTVASSYSYIEPDYAGVQIHPQGDSLKFLLTENTFNDIKSFNLFIDKGKSYIAFYDRRSKSLNIYNFKTCELVDRLKINNWLKGQIMHNTSVYVVNFDSVFVANFEALSLYDSSGVEKNKFKYYRDDDKLAEFNQYKPFILQDDKVFMGIEPNVMEKSLLSHRRWQVICEFDLKDRKKELHYNLPFIYRNNIYGYSFLQYSYCINDKGLFVFSFAADTNIYETNFADYHKAYYAKSRYQSSSITPVPVELLNKERDKQFLLRDAYDFIYYDPFKKRYLRRAKQKITEEAFLAKNRKRKKSIMILDEQFKIIGETELNIEFEFNSVFFTPDGKIYARVNPKNEHALNFIRLEYAENDGTQEHLTRNQSTLPHP
jgi:hypothetical protein